MVNASISATSPVGYRDVIGLPRWAGQSARKAKKKRSLVSLRIIMLDLFEI